MKNETLSAVLAELNDAHIAYKIAHGGKHLRVSFGPNFRRKYVVPKTSSDCRAPLNARADIRRAIRDLQSTEAGR